MRGLRTERPLTWSVTTMMSAALETSALNRRSDCRSSASTASRPAVARPSNSITSSAPTRPSAETPKMTGSWRKLGARCSAIANWPSPMTTNVQIRQGHVAFEPKSWNAAAAPNRKPIERMGPQPVL